MLQLHNIFVKYGDRILLDNVNLTVTDRDKIGLVGRNGAGKSTLLKIISRNIQPDSGSISMPANSTLSFLHQEMNLPKGKTVMAETKTCFEELIHLENRIHELNKLIAERTDYHSEEFLQLLHDADELTQRFDLLGGHTMEADTEKVLKGLGFKQSDFQRLTDEFSGGWQMRIELAKMLLKRPDYLLLDEPTNHLDIESIIWLEGFLETYPGVIIVISHDKQFLDNITNKTVEIELGKIYEYKAPYTKAMLMRADRREKQSAAFANQQKVIAQKERTITRFMAKASKTSMAQSMQKQLDKMERIEIDSEDTEVMKIRFPEAPRSGQIVVDAKNIVKKYGTLTVLDHVDFRIERGERVAFVGQNGQGKTTLAKILINEIPATSGEIILGHNVKIGYYAQNQSDALESNLTLLDTMESNSPPELRTRLRAILGAFLFTGEDAEKKVSVLSGGERARLALACLMLKSFNLLVLDEPTNHLDMLSKEVLKQALMEYDGTLIVVSHDREFLSGLTQKTIEFKERKLYEHLGDVNYFLSKRALTDMRAVELQGKNAPSGNGAKKMFTPEEWQERKRLQRLVQTIEKRIEEIDKYLKQTEQAMAASDFFEKSDAQKILATYQQKKSELEIVMQEWEEAQLTLEAFE